MRIAIGSFLTECNQFGGSPIELDWFARYDLAYGDEVLATEAGVVGGALEVLRSADAQIVPLIYASTCPGGYVTADCYAHLRGELLDRLQSALPVDGVLLPLHGAAVAAGTPDPEGDLIKAVRGLVGSDVPIVVTLDLHAHVTPVMVRHADALVAWETYPHRDSEETGARGARLLVELLETGTRPAMVMVKVPVITGGILGGTNGDGAFAQLMRQTKAMENEEDVLSTSLFLTHPYLDQPHMGSGALVVTDGDGARAEALARGISMEYWQRRNELEADVISPEKAIQQGLSAKGGPVVLVETADCAGGGAAGDSVASLRALLAREGVRDALVPVVDQEAARRCQEAGLGADINISLGHRMDPRWGTPLEMSGTILHLIDGTFRYRGGIWDDVAGDMGPSAVLQSGGVRVLITSHATYDWADEQWQAVGIDPREAQFVVAKNPMNFHNVYDDCATQIHILDTAGPTPASVRNLPFQHMVRPFFPLDSDIEELKLLVLQ